jgi:hypothetical protein
MYLYFNLNLNYVEILEITKNIVVACIDISENTDTVCDGRRTYRVCTHGEPHENVGKIEYLTRGRTHDKKRLNK